MLAIYTMPIIASINGHEAIPIHNKEYQDVFEKNNVNMLLQHRHMIAQLIFKKILNRYLDQSIIYHKTSLLPSKNTLMKILPTILFDIPSF